MGRIQLEWMNKSPASFASILKKHAAQLMEETFFNQFLAE